jgi:hypothetical protein
MKKRRYCWLNCLVIIAILAVMVIGCDKQPGDGKPDETVKPPEIPPISTFVMDFGSFTSTNPSVYSPDTAAEGIRLVAFTPQDGAISVDKYASESRKNWGYAALNVGLWSVVIIVGLAVPVAAFVESFKHEPVQRPDYTWVWTYDVTVKGDLYTAELHGRYIDNGVRWEMYVSKEDGFDDFLWYYGESDLPATEGYWILKNRPSEPSDLLRIDWHRDLAKGTHDIKYTNIVPDGPENGGFIMHGVAAGQQYDRLYEIFNKGKDNHTYIEWNYATDEGRIKDSRHFDDNEWHCWDAEHVDIECP